MNYILDFSNLFIIGYSADPTQNNNGEHVGGITGFLKILQKLVREHPPEKIYIVYDGKGGSRKRKEMNSNYKEGRSVPKPLRLNRTFTYDSPDQENESRRQQQAVLICLLNSLPVHQVILSGVEADDIISYIAQDFDKKKEKSLIISNDKDFLQLLNENISVYRPAVKSILTKEDVIKDYNINPANFVIARAIEGDNSDNLDGVPGVGLKGLSNRFPELKEDKWLSIDEFIELAEKKKEEKDYKMYSSIIDNKKIIEENYKIMQLHSPLIDFNNQQLLEQDLAAKVKLDMSAFYKSLTENGIFGQTFRDLVTYFIRMEMNRK